MSKITKQDLQHQINRLYAADSTRHNKILRIQRALSSIGVDIMSDDFDKPKLKVLDQSVFDDKPEHISWAVVTKDGSAMTFQFKPAIVDNLWSWTGDHRLHSLINQYDASNWQNSLIERESELKGSDLCRAMLARGDKYVMCQTASGVDVISGTYEDGLFVSTSNEYEEVTPINNQGKPLAAKEAGL